MSVTLIEPLIKLIIENKIYDGKKANKKYFGGFCKCGGIMYQKFWFETKYLSMLVSECEKCWRHELLSFNGTELAWRKDVKVINKSNFVNFLKDKLNDSELKALIASISGTEYNNEHFNSAKKKLENINLSIEEVKALFSV